MQLKVHSKIFYPSHGPGWVKKAKVINFNNQERDYLEFEFIGNTLSISTPIDNIDKLGIREVANLKDIEKRISILKKSPIKQPEAKDFNELAISLEELEGLGTIEGFISIIQYCNHEKQLRIKEGRLVPSSIERHFKNAILNIAGEMAVSSDTTVEKATERFNKVTGLGEF